MEKRRKNIPAGVSIKKIVFKKQRKIGTFFVFNDIPGIGINISPHPKLYNLNTESPLHEFNQELSIEQMISLTKKYLTGMSFYQEPYSEKGKSLGKEKQIALQSLRKDEFDLTEPIRRPSLMPIKTPDLTHESIYYNLILEPLEEEYRDKNAYEELHNLQEAKFTDMIEYLPPNQ
ncbi:MAG: hypothetical protein ABH851_03860 [Methanobacteriota archaeon]